MRLLRNLNLNPKAIRDNRLAITANDEVAFNTPHSLILPTGSTSQRSVSPVSGMIRYNDETEEIEVYQFSSWRALRFKESSQIVQQNLGNGDGISVYYGPLNPAPPTVVASGTTWGGQNIMVYVENVYQIFNTNYTVEQNPTVVHSTDVELSTGSTELVIPSTADVVVGQEVSAGGYFAPGTTVTSVDPNLGVVLLSTGSLSTIPVGTSVTFSYPVGYYIKFTGASAYGKPIMILHGFDK